MKQRKQKLSPQVIVDERQPVDADAIHNYERRGLIQPMALSQFATFSSWQIAIRATVDLPTLEFMYTQLGGPSLSEVSKDFTRTEDYDRAWMRAWLYYHGTLQHLRTYAQPTHWKAYGDSWDAALTKFGGHEPIASKLKQLRYDRPLWEAKKKEIEVATKEKRKTQKAAKAAEKAEKANKPMGFRAGSVQAEIATQLLRTGKMKYDTFVSKYKYPADFVNAANKRGFKVAVDKENGVVVYNA